jgi:hypothetical protein
MAIQLLTVPSGYTRLVGMFGGTNISSSAMTPDSGSSTSEWKQDVNFWGHSGDVCSANSSGGIRSGGNNGTKHWQIVKCGTSSGHYLSTEITGFKFKANQDSGAGHGMYIRRYGFRLVQKNGNSGHFFDAGGVLSRGDFGDRNYSHTFNSTILNNYLNNGWCFDEFRYQLSTEGGTGTRTTHVTVWDFQFTYVGSSGKKLILPVRRSYGDRDKFQIA